MENNDKPTVPGKGVESKGKEKKRQRMLPLIVSAFAEAYGQPLAPSDIYKYVVEHCRPGEYTLDDKGWENNVRYILARKEYFSKTGQKRGKGSSYRLDFNGYFLETKERVRVAETAMLNKPRKRRPQEDSNTGAQAAPFITSAPPPGSFIDPVGLHAASVPFVHPVPNTHHQYPVSLDRAVTDPLMQFTNNSGVYNTQLYNSNQPMRRDYNPQGYYDNNTGTSMASVTQQQYNTLAYQNDRTGYATQGAHGSNVNYPVSDNDRTGYATQGASGSNVNYPVSDNDRTGYSTQGAHGSNVNYPVSDNAGGHNGSGSYLGMATSSDYNFRSSTSPVSGSSNQYAYGTTQGYFQSEPGSSGSQIQSAINPSQQWQAERTRSSASGASRPSLSIPLQQYPTRSGDHRPLHSSEPRLNRPGQQRSSETLLSFSNIPPRQCSSEPTNQYTTLSAPWPPGTFPQSSTLPTSQWPSGSSGQFFNGSVRQSPAGLSEAVSSGLSRQSSVESYVQVPSGIQGQRFAGSYEQTFSGTQRQSSAGLYGQMSSRISDVEWAARLNSSLFSLSLEHSSTEPIRSRLLEQSSASVNEHMNSLGQLSTVERMHWRALQQLSPQANEPMNSLGQLSTVEQMHWRALQQLSPETNDEMNSLGQLSTVEQMHWRALQQSSPEANDQVSSGVIDRLFSASSEQQHSGSLQTQLGSSATRPHGQGTSVSQQQSVSTRHGQWSLLLQEQFDTRQHEH